MLDVVINARFLTQDITGMQRFSEEIVSALDKLLDERKEMTKLRYIAARPRAVARDPKWKNIELVEVGRLGGHAWEQIELTRFARRSILVNLASIGPVFHRNSVTVMHDANIFANPGFFSTRYRTWHTLLRPILAKRALRLATISKFSQSELSKYCGVSEDRFHIIGDSAEHILEIESDGSVLTENGLESNKYFLCVGNQSPNKNLAEPIAAFSKLPRQGFKLALAGGGAPKIFGNSADHEYPPGVVALGRVSDEQLRALYENASAFIFPSKYEGFGVPPLEAMSVGCPVIAANSSAMPEVLGDAALYFQLGSIDQLISRMEVITCDKEVRQQLILKGYQQSKKYSWAESARRLMWLIQNAIEATNR